MISIRRVSLWAGVVLSTAVPIAVPADVLRKEIAGGTPHDPHFPSGGTVLYSQLDHASGNGAPDHRWGYGGDSTFGYDSEGADDFVVTGSPWSIGRLNTPGIQHSGTAEFVRITFYPDDAGRPSVFPVPGCAYPVITDFTITTEDDLSINLSPCCTLPPGHYWVGQQVSVSDGSQHFWANRLVQSHHESVWRNPDNGFGTGCTDWTAQTSCGVGGGQSPDFLFELIACEDFSTVGTPAIGPLGIGATVLAVGAAGAYALRRRR
jgi:hypothetical protein